jgi:transcriptional regulator with XRE-family HTH domain
MPKQYDRNFLKALGAKFAEIRHTRKMSQEELASRSELHRTYIGFIEQGRRDPSIGTLKRIATALETDLYEILEAPELVLRDGDPVTYGKKKR